jgi:hypothetical protein
MTDDQPSRIEQPAMRRGFSFAWWIAVSAVHLLLWVMFLGYLVFYVPRQKQIFDDFSVALPKAAILVISLSDLILQTWYLLPPLLLIFVVGVNAIIVALARTPGWRIGLFSFLALIPLGWLLSCHVILSIPLNNLMQGLQ